MPKILDPFWQYGEPEDGNNRKNLTCKLCGHHMSGGVDRLKYHLAKLPGHDVGLCTAVTPEIMRSAHDAILRGSPYCQNGSNIFGIFAIGMLQLKCNARAQKQKKLH